MTLSHRGGPLSSGPELWGLRRRMIAAALAGGVAALGQAPWTMWPATIAGLGLVVWITLSVVSPKRVGLIWWAAGCGYFCVALSWIIEPFLVDIETHGWKK